jgi:CheY-like chemotaxis protein
VNAASRIEYADILLNTGQELLSLLNDILDLSKIEAGKFDLETNSFTLATTFSKIIAMFEETAKAKGLRLQAHDTTPSAQRYIGDAHRLQQMLMNLVGNAIKFTQTGHVGIDVRELDRDNESACLEFSVTDTGVGIPKDNQAKLFQPFTQVDNSTTREFGGTGLGLSLVKEMARLMDGDVGLESQPGQGSRFWFKVRLLLDSGGQQLDATGHGLQTSGGHVATDAVTTPPLMVLPKRIMLVDDNLLNIWVINEMLRQHGHTHVTQFKNGSEAVDAVTRGDAFDLILIDLHMPILGGYEAVQQIRAWEVAHGGARVNIVALTADVNSAVHRQCLEGGIDALLTKPVLIQQLHETLTRWLN